jgi:hypothetical protein
MIQQEEESRPTEIDHPYSGDDDDDEFEIMKKIGKGNGNKGGKSSPRPEYEGGNGIGL